jgi:hypothetical protein
MFSKKLRTILVLPLSLILFMLLLVILLNVLIQKPSIQRYLLRQLSDAIGYEVQAGKIELSFREGVGISAPDLEARSKTGPENIAASRLTATLDAGELIRGRIVPTRISLYQPKMELPAVGSRERCESGPSSTQRSGPLSNLDYVRIFRKILDQIPLEFPSFSLKDARVSINNLPYTLEDLNVDLSPDGKDPSRILVQLKGNICHGGGKVPFTLYGSISQGMKLQDAFLGELKLETGQVPLDWVPWPRCLPVKKGNVKLKMDIKGGIEGPVSVDGRVTATNLDFLIVASGDKKAFHFDKINFAFKSVYSKSSLEVTSLHMVGPDFSVTSRGKLDFQDISSPFLDMKAEAPLMPLKTFKRIFPGSLLPLWVENQLFPLFKGGHVSVGLLSLKGTLNQIENLDLAKNAKALSLRITCKNLEALSEKGALPFNGTSGNLSITDGALFVSEVRANFGRSSVKEASLAVNSLYVDAPIFGVSITGTFDLQDLLRQKDIDLIPVWIRSRLRGFESTTGKLTSHMVLRYEDSWEHLKILKGELTFNNCSIVHQDLFLPLFLDNAVIKIKGAKETQFQGTGLWGKSGFQAKGLVETSLAAGNARVTLQADMNEWRDRFIQRHPLPLKFASPVHCELSLSKSQDRWSFRGEVDLDGVALETRSFSIGPSGKPGRISFAGKLHPNQKVDFDDLRCHVGDSSIALSGHYDLKDRDSLKLRISTERLSLEDLGIQPKGRHPGPKGILKCQAELKTSLESPVETWANGDLEGQGISFALSNLALPIKDCDFKLRLSGKHARIDFMNMQLGSSAIHLRGNLTGWHSIRGDLSINAKYLDLSELKVFQSGPKSQDETSLLARLLKGSDVQLRTKIDKGRFQSIEFGPLYAQCVLRSGDLLIERSKLKTKHTVLTGKGRINTGRNAKIAFSSHIKMTKQPLEDIFRTFGLKSPYLEGELTSECLLFVEGRNKKELISSLTGSANVLAERGKIRKSHTIYKVLEFLSLQNIFKKRPQSLSKEGLYFENIEGHLTFDKGILATRNLVMKSPVFNAVSKGKIDLNREWVDIDLGAQPLGTIDSMVSGIPIVSYLLTGEKKSMIIYYFKAEGPLSNPEVQYVPLANLDDGMLGFFKRLFFTPGRMFEDLSNMSKDFAKKGIPLPDDSLSPAADMGP